MLQTAIVFDARLQIDLFLDRLEDRIDDMAHMAESSSRSASEVGTGRLRFADYVKCRDLSSECWAFSIVIERRLDNYVGPERDTLKARFDRLTISIWWTLLSSSLRFLDSLSKEPHLPLGSREIFVREIKTLYDAQGQLSSPRYAGLIGEDKFEKQRQAQRILNEVIDRAPALLNLDL